MGSKPLVNKLPEMCKGPLEEKAGPLLLPFKSAWLHQLSG